MSKKRALLMDRNSTFTGDLEQVAKGDRWAHCLRRFLPIGVLVKPAAGVDPIPGILLTCNDFQGDTTMVSAYYLSFYD